MLRTEVPLKDMVKQSANLGAFVLGMFNSDLGLIRRSLQDIIIEPQRAQLIPYFFEVKEAALAHMVDAGVVGAYQRSDRLEKRRSLMELWTAWLATEAAKSDAR